jgi:hypothetical protein
MGKTAWGRKESIIWPYYRPLYTIAIHAERSSPSLALGLFKA